MWMQGSPEMDFFTEYGDANRYKIQEVIGKGIFDSLSCHKKSIIEGNHIYVHRKYKSFTMQCPYLLTSREKN
jgi:hypothetical protein